jgi:hypothetical protein
MCERNGLVLLYVPPHFSHFLQCLDLSIFGLTKGQISAINRMEDLNTQTSHILQILKAFMSLLFQPTSSNRSRIPGYRFEAKDTRFSAT